jgi:hypothetical protein
MRVVKEAEERKNEILDAAERLVRQKEIPVLQRLTLAIRAVQVDDRGGDALMEQIHRPQNALMHQKIQERLQAGMNPLLTELLEEGVAEGICHTDYPAEVAEMTFLYATVAFDDHAALGGEERRRKTEAFIYNLERLLQMEQGSMIEAVLPLFSDGAP